MMLSPNRKRTIIACISLLAMTLAVTAFAETIGQRIMRLRREKEQGTKSTYTRDKPAETPKTTPTEKSIPKETPKPVEKTVQPVEKTVVSTPKTTPFGKLISTSIRLMTFRSTFVFEIMCGNFT